MNDRDLVNLIVSTLVPILVSAMTPWASRILARFSSKLRATIAKRKARERAFVRWLVEHPDARSALFSRERGELTFTLIGFTFMYLAGITLLVAKDDQPSSIQGPVAVTLDTFAIAFFALALPMGALLATRWQKYDRIWHAVAKQTGWMTWNLKTWSEIDQKWIPIVPRISNPGPPSHKPTESDLETTDA